jgi:hypothetical protein
MDVRAVSLPIPREAKNPRIESPSPYLHDLTNHASQRNKSAPRADFPRNPVPDFLQYICEWLEMSSRREKSKKAKTMKGKLVMKNRNILFATILGVLACFGFLPKAQAVSPAPDGGYPGGNTAEGQSALLGLTTGGYNTAVGFFSLRSDTTGSFNTASGAGTLVLNTADNNTATGAAALLSNTTGSFNTANGAFALFSNTTGNANANTANGYQALYSNTSGSANTADGLQALYSNTTGYANTALGYAAGYAITGSGNVCIGAAVSGVAGEDGTTRIGNIYDSVASDRAVYVNFDDKLGTLASSRRYKEEIKPMDKASEALLGLKPVTFRYKQELDPRHVPMFGLIAEDVEKVNPDLVTRNKKGEVETVRYDAVNAMLLNEFLKEHKKVEEQGGTINELKKDFRATVAELTERLKEQDSKIEKVSARLAAASPSRGGLEMSKPAPKVVSNNP